VISTNFIDGVTNVAESGPLGQFLAPDPSRMHQWFSDFDSFEATQLITITDPGNATVYRDWLVTQVTGTTATATVTDEDGGVVLMTNDATAAHGIYAQWQGGASTVSETFTFDATKALWMKARFKVSSAANTALVLGLIVTDVTPQANTDGLYFIKADTSTTLNFNATASSASTTVAVGTLANNTYAEVGFAYLPNGDGTGPNIPGAFVYFNGVKVGSFSSFANFPTTELAVTFGVTNGAAGNATTMSTDYILVAKER
jgi:hypothetical protein